MEGRRRVVVTGLGIISPVGNTIEQAWRNILAGESGIATIDSFDATIFTTHFAGIVKNFNPEDYQITVKDARKMDIFVQYGIAAAMQAIKDAGLTQHPENAARIGVSVGSGIGGLSFIEKNYDALINSGPRRMSPFFIPGAIINMISGYVSIMNGYQGPNLAFATACTTGCHSIGMAARCIAYGDADVMVAGGSEKASTPMGLGGFAASRTLSTRNDNPKAASRPWDRDRDGFVLGDGAGVMILEEYEYAKRRGAKIYAELVGFGMSGDAYHITSPTEDGSGAARAMVAAMKDAHLNPEDIHYINAHSTSTEVGDIAEVRTIKLAMGESVKRIPVSSTKSMTGHLLGAAGAVEAIFSVLALRDQVIPPTINLENPGPECDLDFVPNHAREAKLTVTMSNSFGFGGTNGALIFKKT